MRNRRTMFAAAIVVALVAIASLGQAQQVTVKTPFHTATDAFFENSSINWSGHVGGIAFSFGGGVLAKPPFGSPDLTAGLSTAFALVGKNSQINVDMNFSQGYRQALTTQTPSVTMMNGQTGYVSDSSLTPFVVSVIPVVGGFPTGPQQPQQIAPVEPDAVDARIQAMDQAHADARAQAAIQAAAQAQAGGPIPPLPPQQRPNNMAPRHDAKAAPDPVPDAAATAAQRVDASQESSAGRPALSVAEARRLHQKEQEAANGEMAALMERARALEEDGKPNVAKIYYERVAKHASGELQHQARAKLDELRYSAKP